MDAKKRRNLERRMIAVVAVLIMVMTVVPIVSEEETDAVGKPYTYTITPEGKILGNYTPIGKDSSTDIYTSSDGSNCGSWGFDENGYGPFNSFYAAFNPDQENKMICHLNPNNLSESIDGTSLNLYGKNVMWCLPTVYWKTDSSGNLILTNDPDSGGTAYAHTIDGVTFEYLAIGVYEATSGGVLKSSSGQGPVYTNTNHWNKTTLRDKANDNVVNTTGSGTNGHAMLWNFYQWELYKYCVLAVIGDWDSQEVAGYGHIYTESVWDKIYTGTMDTSGPYTGDRRNPAVDGGGYTTMGVKVFIENAWGNYGDIIDGITYYKGVAYVESSSVPTDKTYSYYPYVDSFDFPAIGGFGHSPSTTPNIWGIPTSVKTGMDALSGELHDWVYIGSNTGSTYKPALVVGEMDRQDTANNYIYMPGINTLSTLEGGRVFYSTRLAFVFHDDPMGVSKVTFDHSALSQLGGDVSAVSLTEMVITDGATYPKLPNVGDFEHTGWYVDGQFYAPGTVITRTDDHVASSAWKVVTITITFHIGDTVDSTMEVQKGSTGVVYTPTVSDGVFGGWFYDQGLTQRYDAATALYSDTDLYAMVVPYLVFTSVPSASSTITPIGNNMVFFDATASDGRYSILWDFGDGNTSTDPIAYNTYSSPGKYTVTLTITNIYGESNTATYHVVYGDEPGDGDGGFRYICMAVVFIVIGGLVVRRLL